jgi:hypothetical protein
MAPVGNGRSSITPCHVDFAFFFFYLFPFDRATARTADAILVVGSSQDLFLRKNAFWLSRLRDTPTVGKASKSHILNPNWNERDSLQDLDYH